VPDKYDVQMLLDCDSSRQDKKKKKIAVTHCRRIDPPTLLDRRLQPSPEPRQPCQSLRGPW
jgi:hypothetical protein